MRLYATGWIVLLGTVLFAAEAQLSPRYQTVFILEMNNGLDQHLTSRLTSSRALWVVLEPVNADAVITDSLDDAFWNWLTRTYTSPSPAAPVAGSPAAPGRGGIVARDVTMGGKQRGTVFLVDPRRRIVLWSIYALPRNSAPVELDRTAAHVAVELKKAFGKK